MQIENLLMEYSRNIRITFGIFKKLKLRPWNTGIVGNPRYFCRAQPVQAETAAARLSAPLSREPPSESSVDSFGYTKETPDYRSVSLYLRLPDKEGRAIIRAGSAFERPSDKIQKGDNIEKGRLQKLVPLNSWKGNVYVCVGGI